jgi:hypothetical protein
VTARPSQRGSGSALPRAMHAHGALSQKLSNRRQSAAMRHAAPASPDDPASGGHAMRVQFATPPAAGHEQRLQPSPAGQVVPAGHVPPRGSAHVGAPVSLVTLRSDTTSCAAIGASVGAATSTLVATSIDASSCGAAPSVPTTGASVVVLVSEGATASARVASGASIGEAHAASARQRAAVEESKRVEFIGFAQSVHLLACAGRELPLRTPRRSVLPTLVPRHTPSPSRSAAADSSTLSPAVYAAPATSIENHYRDGDHSFRRARHWFDLISTALIRSGHLRCPSRARYS